MSKQSKIIGFFKRPAEDSISEGKQETELISDKVDEHDKAYEANKDVAAVSLSLKISPGPSTVADKINIETDKMWREKQQLYPWLLCKNGKLGCDFCVSAKGLGPHRTRGLYLSPEWQTTNVTYNGLSQKAKLSSLRKKIFKHLNSDAHVDTVCLHM